ncbi:hypothetical protein C8J56DRAFT_888615 [Mycena floridula]|nr:hypothetical protein C8J56DRAFT_888615 [Mycena floridula]
MTPHPIRTLALTSRDDTKIHASAVGDPDKPAMIVIHGACLGALVFDAVFTDPRWLEAMYLVRFVQNRVFGRGDELRLQIRYDVRGHARSKILKPETEEWRESQCFAEDFEAVVNAFVWG